MSVESEKALEIQNRYAREIGILRTRYQRIVTVYYSTGYYRAKDVTGEILFSNPDPEELGRFLCQAAA